MLKTTKRRLQRKRQKERLKARELWLINIRSNAFNSWKDRNVNRLVNEYKEQINVYI